MMDYRERMDLMVSDPERYRAIVEAESAAMVKEILAHRTERARLEREQRKGHRAPQNWLQRAWSKIWE